MRLNREELLKRYTWNVNNPFNGDIEKVLYGDIPHQHYTWDKVRMINSDRMGYFDRDLDDTYSNVMATDNYIFSQCGEFSKYYTLIGGVRVFKNWHIGTIDLNIKYNGHTYNLTMCDLYGKTIMHLTLITASTYRAFDVGESSKWISTHWTEMSKEEALKVLDIKRIEDYGDVIKMAIKKAREVIENDSKTAI